MPKRLQRITNFDKGILLNASQRDPVEGHYPFAENADSTILGAVKGLNQSEVASSSAGFNAHALGSFVVGGVENVIGQDAAGAIKVYTPSSGVVNIGSIGNTVTQFIAKDGRCIAPCGPSAPARHISYITGRSQFGAALNGYYIQDNAVSARLNSEGHSWHYTESNTTQDSTTNTTSPPARPIFSFLSASQDLIERTPDGTLLGSFGVRSDRKLVGSAVEYVTETDNTTPTIFQSGTAYAYAASLIYDGYQESPLVRTYTGNATGRSTRVRHFTTPVLIRNAFGIKVTFSVYIPLATGVNGVGQRVTGFNIYRAPVSNEDGLPSESFRFVRTIAIDDSSSSDKWRSIAFSDPFYGTQLTGNTYAFDFYDDGFAGATYEENSGIPETLESNDLSFSIGASVNEYFFVSGIGSTKYFDSTVGLIFRSVAGSPSSFNILKDFVQLPETIVAMASFESRLYAFSKSRTYRINPSGLYVESVFEGFGALSSDHVVSTPYGIAHADHSNIYINTGANVLPIGDRVLTGGYSSQVGYRDIDDTKRQNMVLGYDPRKGRLLVMGQYNNTNTKAWLYDFVQKRWDFYAPSNVLAGQLVLSSVIADGVLYASSGSSLVRMFTSASRERVVLVTHDYTFNSDNGEFWLYEAIIRGQVHPDGNNFQYRFDSSSAFSPIPSASATLTSSINGLTHVVRFVQNPKVKSIQLLLGYMSELDAVHFRVRLPVEEE